MPLRFFRRIRIIPGVRVNLSKRGASLSLGRKGAWFTVGPRGTRETVGLPGTGLFYTSTQAPHHADPTTAVAPPGPSPSGHVLRVIVWLTVLAIAAWTFWISRQ
jgi:hypothetical protein